MASLKFIAKVSYLFYIVLCTVNQFCSCKKTMYTYWAHEIVFAPYTETASFHLSMCITKYGFSLDFSPTWIIKFLLCSSKRSLVFSRMLGNKMEVCQYFKMARKLHLRPPVNDEVNKETSFIKRVNFRGHFSDASFNKEFCCLFLHIFTNWSCIFHHCLLFSWHSHWLSHASLQLSKANFYTVYVTELF